MIDWTGKEIEVFTKRSKRLYEMAADLKAPYAEVIGLNCQHELTPDKRHILYTSYTASIVSGAVLPITFDKYHDILTRRFAPRDRLPPACPSDPTHQERSGDKAYPPLTPPHDDTVVTDLLARPTPPTHHATDLLARPMPDIPVASPHLEWSVEMRDAIAEGRRLVEAETTPAATVSAATEDVEIWIDDAGRLWGATGPDGYAYPIEEEPATVSAERVIPSAPQSAELLRAKENAIVQMAEAIRQGRTALYHEVCRAGSIEEANEIVRREADRQALVDFQALRASGQPISVHAQEKVEAAIALALCLAPYRDEVAPTLVPVPHKLLAEVIALLEAPNVSFQPFNGFAGNGDHA